MGLFDGQFLTNHWTHIWEGKHLQEIQGASTQGIEFGMGGVVGNGTQWLTPNNSNPRFAIPNRRRQHPNGAHQRRGRWPRLVCHNPTETLQSSPTSIYQHLPFTGNLLGFLVCPRRQLISNPTQISRRSPPTNECLRTGWEGYVVQIGFKHMLPLRGITPTLDVFTVDFKIDLSIKCCWFSYLMLLVVLFDTINLENSDTVCINYKIFDF